MGKPEKLGILNPKNPALQDPQLVEQSLHIMAYLFEHTLGGPDVGLTSDQRQRCGQLMRECRAAKGKSLRVMRKKLVEAEEFRVSVPALRSSD